MSEITIDQSEQKTFSRWAAYALIVLFILAAIYALTTSGKTYIKPMDATKLPKPPSGSERAQPTQQLRTQSSLGQPVGSNYTSQLQTGTSSLQQVPPNSPQRAGISSPTDLMYTTP